MVIVVRLLAVPLIYFAHFPLIMKFFEAIVLSKCYVSTRYQL